MKSRVDRRAWGLLALAGLAACSGSFEAVQSPYNRGVHFDSMGAVDEAIAEYRTVLEEDPADDRARFNLALALERRAAGLGAAGPEARAAANVEAFEHYQTLAEAEPPHLRASVNLAAMCMEAGKVDQGFTWLDRAATAWPLSPAPLLAAAVHRVEGRAPSVPTALFTEDLSALVARAEALAPGAPTAAWLQGLIAERNGDSIAAQRHLKAGLDRAPRDLSLLVAHGLLLVRSAQAELRAADPTTDVQTALAKLKTARESLRTAWNVAPETWLVYAALAAAGEAAADAEALQREAHERSGAIDLAARAREAERLALEEAVTFHFGARERRAGTAPAWSGLSAAEVDHDSALDRLYIRLAALAKSATGSGERPRG